MCMTKRNKQTISVQTCHRTMIAGTHNNDSSTNYRSVNLRSCIVISRFFASYKKLVKHLVQM